MKVSGIQLEMLLERYRRQCVDSRLTDYGKQIAEETLAALEELRQLRKTERIALEGTVQ